MQTLKLGRPRKREQKDARKELLKAAVLRFADQGFQKVKLADIANDAGVSIGLIRHYFGSKNDLIEECNKRVIEKLSAAFSRIIAVDVPDSGSGLVDLMVMRSVSEFGDRTHLLFYLKHLSVERVEASQEVFTQYFQFLQSELNRLEALGYLRGDTNKVWLTFTLMFMQLGPVYLSDQIHHIMNIPTYDRRAVEERNEEYCKTLKRGILSRKGQS